MYRTKNLINIVLLSIMFTLALAAEVFGTDSVAVTGVLTQDSEGAMELQTPDFIYLIQGNVPESLVGKPVTLSGRLVSGEQGSRWIIVTAVIENMETKDRAGK